MTRPTFDEFVASMKAQSVILEGYVVMSWLHDYVGKHAPSTLYFDCDLCGTRLYSWNARDNHFKIKHKKQIIAYAKSKGVDLSNKKWPQ